MNTTRPATITIERTMNAPAERIYNAFLDPDLMTRYYAPPGTETIFHAFDASVGGEGRYAFHGERGAMAFKVRFLELEPFTKIRHAYAMEGPGMDADMEIQITLEPTDKGTLVRFEQWGIPKPIPVDGATAGWTGMIDRLQAMVEG